MFKRILCVFCSVVMVFSMISPAVYADDEIMNHEHNWVDVPVSLKGEVFGMEYQVSIKHCTICNLYDHTISLAGYSYEYFAMTAAPGVEGIIQNLAIKLYCSIFGENATATKFTPGGGSTSSGGVGRPKGYADDNGTATYNFNGDLQVTVYPRFSFTSSVDLQNYPASIRANQSRSVWTIDGLKVTGRSTYSGSIDYCNVYFDYFLSAPVSGTYYIATQQEYIKNQYTSSGKFLNQSLSAGRYSFYLRKGRTNSFNSSVFSFYCNRMGLANSTVTSYFCPIILTVVPDTTTINQQTNITINNNTWNGNIYTDNSTNLIYIYPQYTTVNENNETVTNISNNPIIYNNETKQYYTYDQTTKNYYYINYGVAPTPTPAPTETPTPSPDPTEEPSPSPSPAPTEKPGGSISTPETGKPGGDTGDTTGILAVLVEIRDNMIQGFLDIKAAFVAGFADFSANFTLAIENLTLNIQNFFFKGMSGSPVDPNIPGGGSISTPETGGSDSSSGSGWSWNPLKWLTDLLKDIVEGIIKTIWKLITSLFGFLLWLLSLVGKLFPFIPGQAVLAVTSAVVIVAVIRIIKFITGR